MKFNEYLSVLVYKLVLVISLINGKALSEKDKTGKHAGSCELLINWRVTDSDKHHSNNQFMYFGGFELTDRMLPQHAHHLLSNERIHETQNACEYIHSFDPRSMHNTEIYSETWYANFSTSYMCVGGTFISADSCCVLRISIPTYVHHVSFVAYQI
jgi:hypothetical protein